MTRCCPRRPGSASPADPTRRSSPTARSPRAPRWPAATTCSKPKTSTRRWRWPATSRPPSTARSRCGRSSTSFDPAWTRADSGQWLALLLEPPKPHTRRARRSGEAQRRGTAIRRRRRRSHRRRRRPAPAGDGDDRAGARRRGAADRRAVRGGRRVATGFYLLTAADRDEAVKMAVDDPRFDAWSCASWRASPASSTHGQPGRRLSARMGPGRGRARPVVG